MKRHWLTHGIQYALPDGRRFTVLSVDVSRQILRLRWTEPAKGHDDVHEAELTGAEIVTPSPAV